MESRGQKQIAQRLQGRVDVALRDDAPAHAGHWRIARQQRVAVVVGEAHFAGFASQGGGERVGFGDALSQAAAVGVIDQGAVAIDDVKRRVAAVEVLAQQVIQHVVLMQVERAAEKPQIAVVGRENGVGVQDQPAVLEVHERGADRRVQGRLRAADGLAVQLLAQQRAVRGRCRQYRALWRHDKRGVELAELPFLALRLGRHVFGMHFHVGQHFRAIRQIVPEVGQEHVGHGSQLGGVGLVEFQRGAQQKITLHQVTGMQAAHQREQNRQQADPQDEMPQVDPEHGVIR